jgi:hypothetical protein
VRYGGGFIDNRERRRRIGTGRCHCTDFGCRV